MVTTFTPIQLGRYLLTEPIARGGMSEVFKAIAKGAMGFEKRVVVKRLLPELTDDPEILRMFITEAKLVCGLEHPNIVQVIELGETQGQYYIAMEHIDGIDAWVLLKTLGLRNERLPINLALFVVAEALNGLGYAHKAVGKDGAPLGVVHRDVSPSNILISCHGDVKLGDFGIARVKHESKTHSGVLRGKYGYMAPEHLAGLNVDSRSDIFSAGTVLCELLLGRRLFRGENEFETMRRVMNVQLDVLDSHAHAFPHDVIQLVRTALQRNVDERYQNAAAFRQDIVDYLAVTQPFVSNETLAWFIARHVVPHIEADQESSPDAQTDPTVTKPWGMTTEPETAPSSPSTVHLTFDVEVRTAQMLEPGRVEPGEQGAIEFDFVVGDLDSIVELPAGVRSVPTEEPGSLEPQDSKRKTLLETPSLQVAGILESSTCEIAADPDLSGDLGGHSVTRVLFACSRDRETGLLVLSNPTVKGDHGQELQWIWALHEELAGETRHTPTGRSCQIYYEAGVPTLISAERNEVELVARLIAEGHLTRPSVEAAMRGHPRWPPMSSLLAAEVVNPLQVSRLITLFIHWRVLDTFSWTGGKFSFYRGMSCPLDTFPTGRDGVEFIVTGVNLMEDVTLEAHIARLRRVRLVANSTPSFQLEQLERHPEVGRIYRRMKTPCSAGEVLKVSANPRQVREAIHLLYESDLVHAA